MGWLGRLLSEARRARTNALMRAAYAAHQAGEAGRATRLYEAILKRRPDDCDALYLLGELKYDSGDYERAIALLGRASALRPEEPAFRHKFAVAANDLGCRQTERGDFAGARTSFEAALRAEPHLVQARFNLANLLHEAGQTTQAIEQFRVAVATEPGHARIWNNLGCALQSEGRALEAAEAFSRAVAAEPDYGIGHKNLGNAQRELGQLESARTSYERALALLPGDEEVSHYLGALRHETPERAPAGYVTRMFDEFADRFDATLVGKLSYRVPALLVETLRSVCPQPEFAAVLDMGCGTGLFGEQVRPFSRAITGVDLSPRMIGTARKRGCYDELLVRDLLEFLTEARPEAFDLAAATDVFVYLGDLSAVFERTRALLRSGGFFAYSVEASLDSTKNYQLRPTGRYCHSREYLAFLARKHGFVELACREAVLREEMGQPVGGYLCVLSSAGSRAP